MVPHILNCARISFSNPEFLFSEDRVRNGTKKLQKSKQKATQGRLDMFFKPITSSISGQKRKVYLSLYTMFDSSNVILLSIISGLILVMQNKYIKV